MIFEKIYIIAIDHSPESYNKIATKLNNLGLSRKIAFEILVGHDGSNTALPHDVTLHDWKQPNSKNTWYNRSMTDGEIGCAISHINCWKKIIEDGVNSALILEEDFTPMVPLSDLEIPKVEYDLAYLSRWIIPGQKDTDVPDHKEWVYPGQSYNAHAYVLTNTGAKELLKYNPQNSLIPSDEFLIATYSDHEREDVRSIYPSERFIAIATKKDYVEQSPVKTMKTTENTNEPYFEILDDSNWEEWKSKYVNHTLAKGEYDLMLDDLGDNIYEFQLFTPKFCKEVVALAEAKDNWTIDRHTFYPTNDVLLQDIDIQKIYHRVLKEVVFPLCIHIWKLEGDGWKDLFSENFMARYTTDRQSHLSLHHDFSHVTMVVKLNDEFEGGGTWFPKYNILSNPKKVGTATLHPGMVTHLHGARPIDSGKRYICVSFMRKEK